VLSGGDKICVGGVMFRLRFFLAFFFVSRWADALGTSSCWRP
jgi:hypothetical protein